MVIFSDQWCWFIWESCSSGMPRVSTNSDYCIMDLLYVLQFGRRQASFKFHHSDFFSSVAQNLANLNYCKVGYAFGICIENLRSHFSRVWLSDFHLLCASSKYLLICVLVGCVEKYIDACPLRDFQILYWCHYSV